MVLFIPERSLRLDKLRRIAPSPGLPKDFAPSQLVQAVGELAAPQRAMGALTLTLAGPGFTGSLIPFLFLFTAGVCFFSKRLLPGTFLFKT